MSADSVFVVRAAVSVMAVAGGARLRVEGLRERFVSRGGPHVSGENLLVSFSTGSLSSHTLEEEEDTGLRKTCIHTSRHNNSLHSQALNKLCNP